MKLDESLDENTAVQLFARFDQFIRDEGTSLLLTGNNLNDQDIPYICEYLKHKQTIETLELGVNYISPVGATFFSKNNKTIKYLRLRNNKIGDEGCDALIMHHQYLANLDVANNNIGDRGVSNIHLNTTLNYLDLSKNSITDIGAAYLSRNSTLEWLSLLHNAIGELGATALQGNQNLKLVNIFSQRPESKPASPALDDRLLKLDFRNKGLKQNYLKEVTRFLCEYILPDIARIILQYKEKDIVPIYFESIQTRVIVQLPRPADLKASGIEIETAGKLLSKSLPEVPPVSSNAQTFINGIGNIRHQIRCQGIKNDQVNEHNI